VGAEIADKGWKKAMQDNPEIRKGANVVSGKVTHEGVAETFNLIDLRRKFTKARHKNKEAKRTALSVKLF
jgi:hypothetical protein